jgi:hypothetical protein
VAIFTASKLKSLQKTYLQTAGTLGLQEVLQGLEKAEAAKNNLSIYTNINLKNVKKTS